MPILRLSTSREARSPVRVAPWHATMRAGDDFKLAVTVYADDRGTPAFVAGSASQLLLWPDNRPGYGNSWDYGLGWFTGAIWGPGFLAQVIPGYPTPVRPGGLNFALPSASSAALWFPRYRLSLQIDLADGEYSQVEGVLQVRERGIRPDALGHVPWTFTPPNTLTDPTGLITTIAPAIVDGLPVDADGFFLEFVSFLQDC